MNTYYLKYNAEKAKIEDANFSIVIKWLVSQYLNSHIDF